MKRIYLLLTAGICLAGCNKFDDDINVNPNLPSQASGTQLIANAALFVPGLSSSPQGEFHAQYLAETQYPVTNHDLIIPVILVIGISEVFEYKVICICSHHSGSQRIVEFGRCLCRIHFRQSEGCQQPDRIA